MIKVKVRPASGEYDASNDVGGYKADEGTDFTPPPQQQKHLHLPTLPKTLAKIRTFSCPLWRLFNLWSSNYVIFK